MYSTFYAVHMMYRSAPRFSFTLHFHTSHRWQSAMQPWMENGAALLCGKYNWAHRENGAHRIVDKIGKKKFFEKSTNWTQQFVFVTLLQLACKIVFVEDTYGGTVTVHILQSLVRAHATTLKRKSFASTITNDFIHSDCVKCILALGLIIRWIDDNNNNNVPMVICSFLFHIFL